VIFGDYSLFFREYISSRSHLKGLKDGKVRMVHKDGNQRNREQVRN